MRAVRLHGGRAHGIIRRLFSGPAATCGRHGVQMSFSLISAAHAAAAPAATATSNPLFSFLPLLILFGIFYFMLIRPQMKRQKEVRNMLSQLARNDEVIAAGIAGRVDEVGESFVTVEIAPNVKIRVQKGAITQVLPKGTLKSS
jgi:preprotein translocase subunit YajC